MSDSRVEIRNDRGGCFEKNCWEIRVGSTTRYIPDEYREDVLDLVQAALQLVAGELQSWAAAAVSGEAKKGGHW